MPTTSELIQSIEVCLSSNQWKTTTLFKSNKAISSSLNICFTPLLATYYLSQCCDNSKITEIVQHIAKNIFNSNKSLQWNYHFNNQQYPNDLDDTIVAAEILLKTDLHPTAKVISATINNLIAIEEKPGGPYRTWFVDHHNQQWSSDIDPVINYRVKSFLSSLNITLPNLEAWLIENTTNKKQSLYYSSFESALVNAAITSQWKWQKLIPSNSYETALLLIMALHSQDGKKYGADLYEYYRLLIETPIEEIVSVPVFIDRVKGDTSQWAGSALLSYSICLSAIHQFQQHLCEQNHTQVERTIEKDAMSQINTMISGLPLQFKRKVCQQATKLNNLSKSPALHYISHLMRPDLPPITKNLQAKVMATNILGWIAYTLHDTAIDTPQESTQLDSCILSRILMLLTQNHFLNCCEAVSPADLKSLTNFVKKTFIEMEQSYCIDVLTKYDWIDIQDWDTYLYQRSAGLIIAPILLSKLQIPSLTIEELVKIYHPLIIARQILDDIHDLDDDLLHRRTTFVTAQVIFDKKHTQLVLTPEQRSAIVTNSFRKISHYLKTAQVQVEKLHTQTAQICMPEIKRLQAILDQQATIVAVVESLQSSHPQAQSPNSIPKSSPPPYTTANHSTTTEYKHRAESQSTG